MEKRFLGIDYGSKRIGLAISDPFNKFAQPLEIVDRTKKGGMEQAISHIVDVCNEYDVGTVVIGLPLNMDGSEGEAVDRMRVFKDLISKALPVRYIEWDERLTTTAVDRAMIGQKNRHKKGQKDKIAAALILQGYLDSIEMQGVYS